jgi:AcrR family transcriptional regulator
MARDAEATKLRIFEAAFEEFARHGIAGARIDRIARNACANKALIYAYFGSKQSLFDEVVTDQVARFQHEVPFDPEDLAAYAGAVYDFFTANPELVRLGEWHALEEGAEGHQIPAIAQSRARRVRLIARAQKAGIVDATFPADQLLALISALARTWAAATPETRSTVDGERRSRASRRRAVVEAARRLVSCDGD